MKKLFKVFIFFQIILSLLLLSNISNVNASSLSSDDIYYQNCNNSVQKYADAVEPFKSNTLLRNSSSIFNNNYAGSFIDNNGILNVGYLDNVNIPSSGNGVQYIQMEYSYNYLLELKEIVSDRMIEYNINSVCLDEEHNEVDIVLSSQNDFNNLIGYLCNLDLYEEEAIDISINSDNYAIPHAKTAYGGQKINDSTFVFLKSYGTICMNVYDNDTGKYGVLTNAHVADSGATMYYNGSILQGTKIGVATKRKHSGTIDAAFVPFEKQDKWDITSNAKSGDTTYTNIKLGSEDLIIQGAPIRKLGQTSGNTTGNITSTNYDCKLTYDTGETVIKNTIRYSNQSLGGDSGGPVYFDGGGQNLFLIAMNFAGPKYENLFTFGIGCNIFDVLAEFNLTPILNGTIFETTELDDGSIQIDELIPELPSNPTTGKVEFEVPAYIDDKPVTRIAQNAFENQVNITNILLPDTLEYIGAAAFKNCRNLQEIIIPNTVTHIDSSAFENCSYLQSVTLPANLVAIGSSAFKECGSLATITIPNCVTHIDSSAFENCSYLQSVTLPTNLVAIGSSAFKGCGSLGNITIPNSVTNIDSSAFENCSYLQTIILSSNLNAIGVSAFKGCGSLGSITIPSSVQYIDDSAFENCVSLVSVIVEREISNITNLGNYAFAGCSSALQIIVPQNRVAEYKNKVYWSSYKSKIMPNSNSFDEYELDCYRVFDIELTLNSKYNKLYKLNVNCAKNYKIVSTANSTVEMKIYDSNMNLVTSGNDLISHYLGKGVYYLDLRFVNDEDSGVITTTFQLTWPVSKYDISMGNTNLLTHLHETTNGNFINKLYLQSVNGEGFYKFTITGYDKNNNLIILPSNAIKVYRSGTTDEIINCYSMIDSSVFAENSENMNSLIVYLYDYLGFYIDICLPTNEYNSLTLNIQKVTENIVDLFELSESQDQNVLNFSGISLGDNLQKMVLKQTGRFELDTNGFSQGQFVVLKVRAIVDDTMVFAEPILYDLSLNNQYEFDMLEGTYYVGYIGADLNVNLSCLLARKVTIYGDSYLDPDPNFVGVNGSEVTLNGGLQYSNEITQGFTRVIYLTTGESRLDYYWYSSDENVARITDFGTVVGLNVNNDTSVKIMAVNIEDPSKVFVKEFIIKKDTKTFDSDPIERYGEIIIDTDVSNEAQIDLSELNVPINWLQYFTWSSSDSDLYVDQFGRIFVDEETIGNTYTITGTYKLNSRVKVYITVKVE